jgi:UDP-N-acetylmuramate dehydrogenase
MEIFLLNSTQRVRLADYTTLRLGGPAACFVEAHTDEDLVAAVRDADAAGEPLLVLGGGSNLVVADDGFPGTVARVAVTGVQVAAADAGAVCVTAAAGEDWDGLVRQCVADGLAGVECLSGIPGLTGATPIQNVGAYGQEVAQTVVTVRAYDRSLGEVVTLSAADCEFGYRTSMFKRSAAAAGGAGHAAAAGGAEHAAAAGGVGHAAAAGGAGHAPAAGGADYGHATGRFVVLGVTFRLASGKLSAPLRYAELCRALGVAEGDRVPLADARSAVIDLRRGKGMVLDENDPDTRSAGSFFTNPVLPAVEFAALQARVADPVPHWPADDGMVKVSAAWLIEHAGFGKGFAGRQSTPARSGVRISAKHTLALTNPGEGSTASLIELAREVRDGVLEAFGVRLVTEPVLVGTTL